MAKYVLVKFPNGDQFKIPAFAIAQPRATYYADKEEGKQKGEVSEAWEKLYREEVEIALDDDFTLTDWLWNNMNWEDVEKYAISVGKNKKYNYSKHWMEITEDEDNYEVIKE